jgi:lysophospholipase L1-like esterase
LKRLAASTLLAVASTVTFLLATEVFFWLFPGRIPVGVEFLSRARIYEFDRDLGVVLRPGVNVRVKLPRLGRTIRVTTVSHGQSVGFRDHAFRGGPRVAILGDSYVFGYGVDQDETFPAQLERKLRSSGRAVDVLNAGVPGYGARLERILLEKDVLPLHPALVFVAVFENDFKDNIYYAHRRFGALRTFLGVHSVVYDLFSAARSTHGIFTPPGRGKQEDHGMGKNERLSEGYAIEREEIARMATVCRKHGARFAVILLPAKPPLDLRRVVGERSDVPVLDLSPRFSALPRERYLNPYVGHLTPEANGWVADAIMDFIEKRGFLEGAR